MYGETNSEFSFSSGWLERFKSRYEIKSYKRFEKSGSIIMENIKNELPSIQSKLDQFELKDIYNMDETGLFYRLEADHSLATKQFEGRKKDKERITLALCCNGDGSGKVPLWIIELTIANDFRHCKIWPKENNVFEPQVSELDEAIQEVGELDEGIQELNDVISNLAYRNVMDVEHLLNYPNENNTIMESLTEEEIIQSVMNNDDENDLEQDDDIIVHMYHQRRHFKQ
ncbi:CENP-B homolog protein 1-like [Solanum dulcamara]|uniref:CENP-B homolog protein 1-like n=1 Tax=Solanum dulcamara TaxID=45834 RepID=UPI0024857F6E|nr:CENP-B homolog protein 1-like [Solanum dulcamara]